MCWKKLILICCAIYLTEGEQEKFEYKVDWNEGKYIYGVSLSLTCRFRWVSPGIEGAFNAMWYVL